jgi:uncharacterized OB-fold protein
VIDERIASFEGGELRLWGSRCVACGIVSFPARDSCPACTHDVVERHALRSEGHLWSWTVQGFPPKSPPYAASPEEFVPFGVGYVELAGELRIESILTAGDPDALSIGMPMRLVAIMAPGREKERLMTFAFAPVEERA